MRNLRKYWLVFLLLAVSGDLLAQNGPLTSYYMFNTPVFNPSTVGMENGGSLTLQLRSQWTGYSTSFDGNGGAPLTQVLSLNVPVWEKISGIGINVVNDELGPVTTSQLGIPVSFRRDISLGELAIGVQPMFINRIQRFNELRFNDPSDPFNIGTSRSQIDFDFGLGLMLVGHSNYFVGLSSNNILEHNFDFEFDSLSNVIVRDYQAFGGTSLKLYRDFTLRPSLIVRTDLTNFSFDLNVLVQKGDKAWGGISYRYAEAIVFMMGYSFLPENKLRIGYSMDYIVNERRAKQFSSQEVYVRYDLPDLILGGKKRVKTPRFTH
ncbi:MAG: PorP/SprF family type IX secretion system membrane protein [Cyclobacteriaceae bacterium]